MLTHVAIGGLGIVILVGGGELLVKGSASLARSMGISPLVVGLTVVAFGTSAPELAVSVLAAFTDSGTLAFGNIFGSNMANIGLIIGLSAVLHPLPIDHVVIRRELPMMLLALAAAMVMAFDIDLGEQRNAYARSDGLVLLLFFFVFIYYTLGDLGRQRGNHRLKANGSERSDRSHLWARDIPQPEHSGKLLINLALIAIGLVGLTFGADLVVRGGVGIAKEMGIPEVVVGLTLVAVGTSLPELAATLAAVRRNDIALAVGGVVGSNIFNTLLITGVASTIRPMPIPAGGHIDLAATAVLSLSLFFVARTHNQRIIRYEGLSLLVLWGLYVTVRSLYLSKWIAGG
jgi:cation:H+ antiporter